MRLINIKINDELLCKFNDKQLNCIYIQMTEAKKIADQKVIDDEVVGDFYENFDLIEKIYSDRQKTLQKTSY
ncbi:MAG: hypothetical protein GX861_03485 [Tenericutes bacterium]|jgi:hypothetical protein|nr:hypothetical protein [Mycoplasmatota bacterium]